MVKALPVRIIEVRSDCRMITQDWICRHRRTPTLPAASACEAEAHLNTIMVGVTKHEFEKYEQQDQLQSSRHTEVISKAYRSKGTSLRQVEEKATLKVSTSRIRNQVADATFVTWSFFQFREIVERY